MRPHSRQWCFLLERENVDLTRQRSERDSATMHMNTADSQAYPTFLDFAVVLPLDQGLFDRYTYELCTGPS